MKQTAVSQPQTITAVLMFSLVFCNKSVCKDTTGKGSLLFISTKGKTHHI